MSSRTRAFRSLTLRQRILLVAVLLLVPVLLFGLLEVGLRLAGYGTGYPLFQPVEGVRGWRAPNPEIAGLYFRHEAGMPTPAVDLFRAEKGDDAFRIAVQGASTVAGFPFRHGGAFPRMLEQRLQRTFPDRDIEVVNTALDATNSYTLRDLAGQIRGIQPDAVLIYAGHNEFYGVLGAASAESGGRAPFLVSLYLAAQRLRTVQLLYDGMDAMAALWWKLTGPPDAQPRTLMEYLASRHTVDYGSRRYQAGIRQYERNLAHILDLYAEAGIPVYLGTLASNLRDRPPFIGGPGVGVDTAAWNRDRQAAETALDAGDLPGARAALDRLTALDTTAATPFFLRGRLLEREGDTAAARDAYAAARDRDRLPFRAPGALNGLIHQAAEREGVHLVDTEAALAAASPGGIVDGAIMLEHVHPTLQGQLLLADAFYRALEDQGAIGAWTAPVPLDSARATAPVTVVDSVAGHYTVARLTSTFPFAPAGTPPARPGLPETDVEGIALAFQQGRVPWIQAMSGLQRLYAEAGDWGGVAHVNRVVAQEMAHTPEPLIEAALAALRTGDDAAAARDLAGARRRLPTAREAWLQGNLLARAGDTAGARTAYQRARRLDRRERRAAAALAALDTLPGLEAAYAERPADPDLRASLAVAYFQTGRYRRAAELAEGVLASHPDHPLATTVRRQVAAIYGNARE